VSRLRSLILGTLVCLFAGLAALAGLSYLAEREARQRAQLEESRALATLAERASAAGDQPTAMLLALEALPSPAFGGDRPLSADDAAALREAWTWNKETPLAGHSESVTAAAFSPDGGRILTASDDRTARVWDMYGLRPVATALDGHAFNVRAAAIGADGSHVVTLHADGTLRIWDLSRPLSPPGCAFAQYRLGTYRVA
jgi:hypothetical protein